MFYLLVNLIISFKQGKYTSCYYCFFLFSISTSFDFMRGQIHRVDIKDAKI